MKAHKRRNPTILDSYNFNIILSVTLGLIITLICTCLCAFLISKIDVTIKMISFMNIISLGIGSYISGYFSARKRQQKGILSGSVCGIIISCILILGGLILNKGITVTKLCKIIISLVCAIIGGIISANKHIS